MSFYNILFICGGNTAHTLTPRSRSWIFHLGVRYNLLRADYRSHVHITAHICLLTCRMCAVLKGTYSAYLLDHYSLFSYPAYFTIITAHFQISLIRSACIITAHFQTSLIGRIITARQIPFVISAHILVELFWSSTRQWA